MDCEALNNSICPPGSKEMVNICNYSVISLHNDRHTDVSDSSHFEINGEQERQPVERLVRGYVSKLCDPRLLATNSSVHSYSGVCLLNQCGPQ